MSLSASEKLDQIINECPIDKQGPTDSKLRLPSSIDLSVIYTNKYAQINVNEAIMSWGFGGCYAVIAETAEPTLHVYHGFGGFGVPYEWLSSIDQKFKLTRCFAVSQRPLHMHNIANSIYRITKLPADKVFVANVIHDPGDNRKTFRLWTYVHNDGNTIYRVTTDDKESRPLRVSEVTQAFYQEQMLSYSQIQ